MVIKKEDYMETKIRTKIINDFGDQLVNDNFEDIQIKNCGSYYFVSARLYFMDDKDSRYRDVVKYNAIYDLNCSKLIETKGANYIEPISTEDFLVHIFNRSLIQHYRVFTAKNSAMLMFGSIFSEFIKLLNHSTAIVRNHENLFLYSLANGKFISYGYQNILNNIDNQNLIDQGCLLAQFKFGNTSSCALVDLDGFPISEMVTFETDSDEEDIAELQKIGRKLLEGQKGEVKKPNGVVLAFPSINQ